MLDYEVLEKIFENDGRRQTDDRRAYERRVCAYSKSTPCEPGGSCEVNAKFRTWKSQEQLIRFWITI